MEWFKKLLKKIQGEDSIDFVVTGVLPIGETSPAPEPLVADECYVELRLASLKIPKTRRLTSRFNGVVHAFTRLARWGSKDIELVSVVAPEKLAGVDPENAHKAVLVDKRVMGPVAWRGGNLDLEMGLFSVKSTDLAEPFIGLLTDIATTAGVSFVAAAAPFVPSIKKGLELLAGTVGDGALEIGISTSIAAPASGTYAIIGVGKNKLDESKLSVDGNDWRLLLNGAPLESAPYLVFRITQEKHRPDFGAIPELASSYANFIVKVNEGVETPAEDALKFFKRNVYTSPDLIQSDADTMFAKAEAIFKKVFAGGPTAGARPNFSTALADIRLYDN